MANEDVYGEPPSAVEIAAMIAVLALAVGRFVANRARRTVVENAQEDPAHPKCRWVVEPDACDFCKKRGSFTYEPDETPTSSHSSCKCHPDTVYSDIGGIKGPDKRKGRTAEQLYRSNRKALGGSDDFPKLDNREIEEMQARSNEAYALMSAKQKKSLAAYTGDDYKDINAYLFGKTDNMSRKRIREIKRHVSCIDSTMSGEFVPRDTLAWKGAPAKYYTDWNVGDVKRFDGYFSCDVTGSIAEQYRAEALKNTGDALMIEIRMPKGTRSLYIGENTMAEQGNEFELLLGRGTSFKVLHKDASRLVLEVVAK